MDFELSAEQKDFQSVMRDFVNKEINPVAMEMEKSGEYPTKIVQGLKDLGLFGMTIPEEYGGLDLDLAVFEQALNLFGHFGFDAVADFDDLFDLVTADFLHISFVEEAHVHFALGQFVAQHVFDLHQLKVGIAKHGDLFVFEFNSGRGAFEVKARDDFFGRVFNGVFYFRQIGFKDGVKRRHSGRLSKSE
jgi:hypothetical protein